MKIPFASFASNHHDHHQKHQRHLLLQSSTQPFPYVQESSTTRDPWSLNPFSEIRRREEEISLKRDRMYNEDQSKFLIEYASG